MQWIPSGTGIVTGLRPISVKQSRVDDRKLTKLKDAEPFAAAILLRYMRRVPSIDNLIRDIDGRLSQNPIGNPGSISEGIICNEYCTPETDMRKRVKRLVETGSER